MPEPPQEYRAWQAACDEIIARPFPPQSSSPDITAGEIERDARISFQNFSNWEIVCQEILDTQHSHVHYQKCYDELKKRGKTEQEILEMRRIAWYTAGWLNYPMMLWDWVRLDESDMLRAIEWLMEAQSALDNECLLHPLFYL